MNARFAATVMAGLAALAGSTVAVADGSQSIQATIRADGNVEIRLQVPAGDITVGDDTPISALVFNGTGGDLQSARVVLHDDESGLASPGGRVRVIGKLAAGATETVSWNVCARASGNYVLVVTVDAAGPGGRTTLAESVGAVLSAKASHQKCRGPEN